MQDFEKLGLFYLGKEYDVAQSQLLENLVLYDSKDLVTHAVCIGMTGSGKTGLCISLIEEAAIDGVPAIVVDPKGDLTNLMLTFPSLSAGDLLPWIQEEEARKKGVSPQEYAEAQAAKWSQGLQQWGQDTSRIQRLKNAADFCIYTPGSTAGIPLSVLSSFSAPTEEVLNDPELFNEAVQISVSSLLSIAGIDYDPIESREFILLSAVLRDAWQNRTDLDLPNLILNLQKPPFEKIGVIDLESFYPAKERFALSLRLNNLLASPGFDLWMKGEPFDVGHLLYQKDGKPRVSILSIAHLNDAERMFFVTLLLNRVIGWMRNQSGTTSLRALFYMDEIFGYFPPTANPPSKTPLLTLLKQARAFGLGVVLSTQNPVDLDYKGLSNAGTWFIGRLQTQRDKDRVLEGLQSVADAQSSQFDSASMDRLLSSLGNRVFLLNNVHEDHPVVFQTRWALSYLSGPLTRDQIHNLMKDRAAEADIEKISVPSPSDKPSTGPSSAPAARINRPVLPPDIEQFHVPVRSNPPPSSQITYVPHLYGSASIFLFDKKMDISHTSRISHISLLEEAAVSTPWEHAEIFDMFQNDFTRDGENGNYRDLLQDFCRPRFYANAMSAYQDFLYRTYSKEIWKSPSQKIFSQVDESEKDFRMRIQQAYREQRDQIVEDLRKKYATKMASIEEKIRRAEQTLAKEQEQSRQQKLQTAVSIGTSFLSALFGRKTISATSLGRASTAMRSVGRSVKESQDISRAQENLSALEEQLRQTDQALNEETTRIDTLLNPLSETFETVSIRPRKTDIKVDLAGLLWIPYWVQPNGTTTPAFGR